MLKALTSTEVQAIHTRGLGLGRDSTPWDHIAESWRSALWALCHPHWQPASTQRFSNLFLDLAGPMVGPEGMEEAIGVRDHLVDVGDLIRLPGGEWLPAPMKLIAHPSDGDAFLFGGMPSWVLAEAHRHWLGSAGFRRSSREGLHLPRLDLGEWCLRTCIQDPEQSLEEATQIVARLYKKPWAPDARFDLKNRALGTPSAPPTGAWVQVKDHLTHELVGIAEREAKGWSLRTLPAWMDGRMAHLVCQARANTYERWVLKANQKVASIGLYVKLPDWHWRLLQCCCQRPPVQDPENHRWMVTVAPDLVPFLESRVFTPLKMLLV